MYTNTLHIFFYDESMESEEYETLLEIWQGAQVPEDTEVVFQRLHALPNKFPADSALIVHSLSRLADMVGVEVDKRICLFNQPTMQCLDQAGPENLGKIHDFWMYTGLDDMPSKMRLAYYMNRLFKAMKLEADYRKLKICFETAFDSLPEMTWFKDVRGSHLAVNKKFCEIVGKDKSQIYKRGHYYIWDITPEEYAEGEYVCMESEEVVMDARKTCVFEEEVKLPDGTTKQYMTYKSPLIDKDGTLFGTCGIALSKK